MAGVPQVFLFSGVHADNLSVPCARAAAQLLWLQMVGVQQDASDELHLIIWNVLVPYARLQSIATCLTTTPALCELAQQQTRPSPDLI